MEMMRWRTARWSPGGTPHLHIGRFGACATRLGGSHAGEKLRQKLKGYMKLHAKKNSMLLFSPVGAEFVQDFQR